MDTPDWGGLDSTWDDYAGQWIRGKTVWYGRTWIAGKCEEFVKDHLMLWNGEDWLMAGPAAYNRFEED